MLFDCSGCTSATRGEWNLALVGERSSDDRDVTIVVVFSILIVGTTGAIVTFGDVDKDDDDDDEELMDWDEEEVVDDEVELVDSLRDTELLLLLLLLLFVLLLFE